MNHVSTTFNSLPISFDLDKFGSFTMFSSTLKVWIMYDDGSMDILLSEHISSKYVDAS